MEPGEEGKEVTEAELQKAVIEMAHIYGWRTAHFRPAMNERGQWRTPVAGMGKGFPDLVLVSDIALAFVELKSAKGRIRPEQAEWIEALEPHADVFVWRPKDWLDGTIETYLKEYR